MVVIAYRQARDAPHAPPPHGPHIRASACGIQAGCIATQGALEHERSHRSRLGKLHRYPPPSGWPWSGYRCYGPISMRLQPAYLAVKSVWGAIPTSKKPGIVWSYDTSALQVSLMLAETLQSASRCTGICEMRLRSRELTRDSTNVLRCNN